MMSVVGTNSDTIICGGRAAGCERWTVRATHTGDFGDIPPTGLRIEVTGIATVRIARRLLVVENAHSDTLGLLRQLGVIDVTTKLPAPLLF